MTLPKPQPAIIYKEFYNKDRGLPEPRWSSRVASLQCPTCGSVEMYYSGSPDDPEEALGMVRCGHCGHITDYFEASKQRENHPTGIPREVVHP